MAYNRIQMTTPCDNLSIAYCTLLGSKLSRCRFHEMQVIIWILHYFQEPTKIRRQPNATFSSLFPFKFDCLKIWLLILLWFNIVTFTLFFWSLSRIIAIQNMHTLWNMTEILKSLNFQQLLKCILKASLCLGKHFHICGLDHFSSQCESAEVW